MINSKLFRISSSVFLTSTGVGSITTFPLSSFLVIKATLFGKDWIAPLEVVNLAPEAPISRATKFIF